MNLRLKNLLAITAVLLFFSCDQSEKKDAGTPSITTTSNTDTTVQYTSFRMQLSHDIETPAVNEKVTFQFKPIAQPGNIAGRLETVHEKKIHFIIVSRDLSYFDHLHLDTGSAGVYSVQTSFPSAGNYLLIADYKPQGLPAAIDTFNITVKGKENPAVKYTTSQFATTIDSYDIQLLTKKIYPLSQSQLIMKIKKDGKDVLPDQLQSYLGEKSHLIAINTTTKEYIHSHAMSDKMSYWYMITFPRAGFYRLWLQFKTNGVVHTAAFVVEVVNTK